MFVEVLGDSVQKFCELFRRRFPANVFRPESRVLANRRLEIRLTQVLTHFRHRQHPWVERLQQNAEQFVIWIGDRPIDDLAQQGLQCDRLEISSFAVARQHIERPAPDVRVPSFIADHVHQQIRQRRQRVAVGEHLRQQQDVALLLVSAFWISQNLPERSLEFRRHDPTKAAHSAQRA